MNPETNLSLAECTHRTDSVTLEESQQVVLAVALKTGEAHYTEETPTIPETLELIAKIDSHYWIGTAVEPAKPGQAGNSSRVPSS